MTRFSLYNLTIQLLRILGICLLAHPICDAQPNTPISLIDQLNSIESKSATNTISIINESADNEQFEIHLRQIHNTNSGMSFKSWFGHSLTASDRTIHITHSDKSILARISSKETSLGLEANSSIYRWAPNHSITKETVGCTLKSSKTAKSVWKTSKSVSASDLLEYEVALTATPQFSALHGNTTTDVLLAILDYVNQVNTIYQRDLGITLKLVDDSEKLIFIDGQTNPFSNQVDLAVSEHITILNDSIGESNYDIGHLLRVGGGGLANIQVACTDNKGYGTSGFEDAASFYLLLAHEIGHQIGAGHTWNSCSSTLNPTQRSPSSAMEPGSGNTIMAYPGLCGSNNIASGRDPYFHSISIDQIHQFTRSGEGNTCAQVISAPNTPPTITASMSTEKAIPIATPFILSGNAIDNEDTILTHAWDQIDQDLATNVGVQTLYNPIIKSRNPTIQTQRHIPDLDNLANEIEDLAELTPTIARTLEFRHVVRDNHTGNGNVSWIDSQLHTDKSAGPFRIIDNSIRNWKANGTHPIEWDVANTDNAKVDCQLVDILIDYDGRLEFKDTLAHNVPNDGLHYVQLPSATSDEARIMIRAADNIFFDISSVFPIRTTGGQDFHLYTDTTRLTICKETEVTFKLKSRAINGFFNPIRHTVGALDSGLSASISGNDKTPGFVVDLKLSVADDMEPGKYLIPVEAFAVNGTTQTITFALDITEDNLAAPSLQYPNNSEIIGTEPIQFMWNSDVVSSNNILQISDNPSFAPENIIIQDSTSLNQMSFAGLNKGAYFWRVQSKNNCSDPVSSPLQYFGLKSTSCQSYSNDGSENISNSIDSAVSDINIPIDLPIESIYLSDIRGTHSFVGDLSFTLISPSGDRFRLLQNECNESKNFNLGIDDKSGRLRCGIDQGLSYKPVDSFNRLKGSSSQGKWTLVVIDNIPGDEGRLENWQLNICSYDNPSNPVLINSDTLKLKPNQEAIITSNILEHTDLDNAITEISYIIISETTKGQILLGTDTLGIGDSFTQADVNNGLLKYNHSNTIQEIDVFNYLVTDGEGFVSSVKQLHIAIKTNVGTTSIEDTFGISIFPNPVEGILYIDGLSNINENIRAQLFHINGRLVDQKTNAELLQSKGWNISQIPSGIYLLNLRSDTSNASKKVIIQR